MADHVSEYNGYVRDVKGSRGSYVIGATVAFGSSGAPTLTGPPGMSISRDSTGTYSLTFPKCVNAVILGLTPVMATPADACWTAKTDLSAANGDVTIVHFPASGAGAVSTADPASGNALHISLLLIGSSAGAFA